MISISDKIFNTIFVVVDVVDVNVVEVEVVNVDSEDVDVDSIATVVKIDDSGKYVCKNSNIFFVPIDKLLVSHILQSYVI